MIDLKELEKDLTERQIEFCRLYVIHLNGTKAATDAKYTGNNIGNMASQLLSTPKIQVYIEALRAEQKERLGITADRVLLELSRLSFFDPRKLYDAETGVLLPPNKWDDDTAAAIKSISTKEIYEKENGVAKYVGDAKSVTIHDKHGSLKLLGMHLGIFEKDNKQKTSKVIVVTTEEAAKIMSELDSEV